MEIKQYVKILWKRLWLILLLPAIAAGSAGYISFYYLEPVYEAGMSLYVINKTIEPELAFEYTELMAAELMVKDYRELIRSRTIAGTVVDELKLKDISPEALAGQISVSAKNETRIIEIRVQDGNPEMAATLANKVGEVFSKKVIELMRVDAVSIVDKAIPSKGPIKPRPYMNIAIALFAGLMAAVGIIFLIEYLDDTVKNPEDVENTLGMTVLGTIPVLGLK